MGIAGINISNKNPLSVGGIVFLLFIGIAFVIAFRLSHVILLRDIATIADGFEKDDLIQQHAELDTKFF